MVGWFVNSFGSIYAYPKLAVEMETVGWCRVGRVDFPIFPEVDKHPTSSQTLKDIKLKRPFQAWNLEVCGLALGHESAS